MNSDDLNIGKMAAMSLREIAKESASLNWHHGAVKIWDAELARRASLATIKAAEATYWSAWATSIATVISAGALVVAVLSFLLS